MHTLPESLLARLLGADFLLWTPHVQKQGYLNWEKIFATRPIRAVAPSSLVEAKGCFEPRYTFSGRAGSVDDLMRNEHLSGLLVLHRGEILLERYGLGLTREGRWQSSSVVKSLASILVGAAMHDGLIRSLDDLVTDFVPELVSAPAYEGVTLRHLLMMSSGVDFSEDYEDLNSDVVRRYMRPIAERRPGAVLEGLRDSRRIAAPGERFAYNTGDTYLLGIVLSRVTGGSVAEYCSRRVWGPMGMEQDGYFTLDSDEGIEVMGSCCGATLRDYGRLGQLMLNDGVALNGDRVLPVGWVSESTAPSAPAFQFDLWEDRGAGFQGYGYLWWVLRPGTYSAIGVYGQWIHVIPEQDLVFVMIGAMPREVYMDPSEPAAQSRGNQHGSLERVAFIEAVAAHVHD